MGHCLDDAVETLYSVMSFQCSPSHCIVESGRQYSLDTSLHYVGLRPCYVDLRPHYVEIGSPYPHIQSAIRNPVMIT